MRIKGLDGFKTGSTDDAGYCFTGTAERNGMRIITVVMGTKTEPERFNETRKLLDYGFNNFEMKPFLNANQPIDSLKSVNIKKGVQMEVPLVTKTGLTFVARKGAKDTDFQITTEAVEESKLVAPITKGDTLGKVKVSYNGQEKTVDLIAMVMLKKEAGSGCCSAPLKTSSAICLMGLKAALRPENGLYIAHPSCKIIV